MTQMQSTSTHARIAEIGQSARNHSEPFARLIEEIGQVIVGQDKLIHRMLVGLLSNGHLLIEGVPGLAKTLAVACLAKSIDTGFKRLQFTPDLLPADLIGTLVYHPQDQTFAVQKGPLFSNLILADEINRGPTGASRTRFSARPTSDSPGIYGGSGLESPGSPGACPASSWISNASRA